MKLRHGLLAAAFLVFAMSVSAEDAPRPGQPWTPDYPAESRHYERLGYEPIDRLARRQVDVMRVLIFTNEQLDHYVIEFRRDNSGASVDLRSVIIPQFGGSGKQFHVSARLNGQQWKEIERLRTEVVGRLGAVQRGRPQPTGADRNSACISVQGADFQIALRGKSYIASVDGCMKSFEILGRVVLLAIELMPQCASASREVNDDALGPIQACQDLFPGAR
ncbi:MAG: hypothetical protein JSR60_06685 [Proteobacteria bacterium]|nr:hypothetical protein [Pseudomonadota bacterium]